jgi:DTW domain-containing protein
VTNAARVDAADAPRAVCARCRRPESVCYCEHVTPLTTRTRVVIFQHPRERDVPINTARIAALCLPEAELHVGVRWSGTPALARALSDPDRPAALLYPGPDAVEIEAPPGPVTLVVLDGTWWQAKKLLRENPELARLPRYAFRPAQPSDYRIRKEPTEECVSTIEALVHALGVLEGDPARFAAMLEPFRAMVDTQLEFVRRRIGRPRVLSKRPKRPPTDPRSRLPRALLERPTDLVCVHGEANSWPYGTEERRTVEDELVHWVAYRMATGETFELFVAPDGALAPNTARHLEVDGETITGGVRREVLLEAWSRFVRPSDVLCSWGTYAPKIFARAGGERGGSRIDLRRAAQLYLNDRVGTIEAAVGRLGGAPPSASPGRGRAGRRLGNLVAIARALGAEHPAPRE